jgi:DNA-binding response OmpR family regulator
MPGAFLDPPVPGPDTGLQVLVVDDEPDVAREVADGLADEGYACLVVHSGQDALLLLQGGAEAIGAVLTDVRMPGLDGFALARAVQDQFMGRRAVEVLLMTGHADRSAARAAGLDESAPVVLKPFRWDELTGALAGAMARASARRAAAAT